MRASRSGRPASSLRVRTRRGGQGRGDAVGVVTTGPPGTARRPRSTDAGRGFVVRQASLSVSWASRGMSSQVTPEIAEPLGTPTSSPSRRTSSATRSTASSAGAPATSARPMACAMGTNRSGTAAPLNRITCGRSTPLTTPCGRSSIPPAWWLIACVAPRIALVKASPASSAAWAIALRAAGSCGRIMVRTRLRVHQRDRLQRVVVGQRAVGQRDERLDAVGQRVQAGRGVEVVRHRGEQPRVDHRHVRDERAPHDGDLGVPLGVGDDAELGDVRARARRRRQHDHRRDRVLDPVDALVVEDPPAVGREQRDALGRVHHRAAADAEHDVAAGLDVAGEPGLDLVVLGVRRDVEPQLRNEARRAEVGQQLARPAGLEQPRIGDDERPAGAQPDGRVRGLLHGVGPEHDLRGVELRQAQRRRFGWPRRLPGAQEQDRLARPAHRGAIRARPGRIGRGGDAPGVVDEDHVALPYRVVRGRPGRVVSPDGATHATTATAACGPVRERLGRPRGAGHGGVGDRILASPRLGRTVVGAARAGARRVDGNDLSERVGAPSNRANTRSLN